VVHLVEGADMGLRENIRTEPVAEVRHRALVAVSKQTSVKEAAEKMRRHKVGCVIVVDQDGKPVGKFTERQLMKLMLEDARGLRLPVERFMYADPDAIGMNQPIAQMVELMKRKKLRFLCVTDDEGRAVALTGQHGLMEYITEHFPRQVKVQLLQSKLGMDEREGA
jgi:CBS domain-containing protein